MRTLGWIAGLALALVALFYLSLCFGATAQSTPAEVWAGLTTREGVVGMFRLPRALSAMLVGSLFAVSGALLQSLTRNPLVSPDLIGVTSGGGLAAVLAILVLGSQAGPMLPLIVFLGAVTLAGLVWWLGRGASQQRFVLTGVALGAFSQAVITLLLVTYAPSAAEAMIWLKGSLYGRTWLHVGYLAPWCLTVLIASLLVAYQVNPLLLGEEVALSLGVRLTLLRPLLWLLSVAAAAAAVSVAGTIGFVGLVVPHMARLLVGADLRRHLPVAMLLGALLVLLADTVGRVVAPPLEIPAGLFCAVLGAPYFGYLLWKGKTAL